MTSHIFIGIDGGGTKTKIRVETMEGLLLGQAVGGPANVRISVQGAWQSIYAILDEIFQPLNLAFNQADTHFHAALGLAGLEVREAHDAFLREPHPFKTLLLTSDAHIACVGAHAGLDGAIIIVGTGVVGYQIQKGKTITVGGVGFPHDDIGGGAWLGLEATRLTFQWLDRRSEKSPLVEDIFAFFNHDLNQFIHWANAANSTEFARLAPLVINHAQQEEIQACRLMKKAAHAIDRIGYALAKQSEEKKYLPCCLFGGIAPFIEPLLSEELRAHLVPRKNDATMGALLMLHTAINKVKEVQTL